MKDFHSHPEGRSELIRARAYELYVARGGAPGAALEDWLVAEEQIRKELAALETASAAVEKAPQPARKGGKRKNSRAKLGNVVAHLAKPRARRKGAS